jgi:UDPglucose 6-dehydrogenase
VNAPRLSVVGLGKLGSPLAACLASKGYTVVGVDTDPTKVELINRRRAPVFEPGLDGLLENVGARVSATTDPAAAVAGSDVTFVAVATPSEDHGGFSLHYVEPVCETIGRVLADKDSYHLVVLTSTVMPGATGSKVREILERWSGKECGADFGLCYSPEFIALGSVIHDFLHPDFVLIGESDAHAGDVLTSIYRTVCGADVPVARMNLVNAEIAKLSVNTFVTTKIAFANMLARVCEHIPQADVDVVTSAIGLDSRIGRKYLKGAISYGGPCFPRDNLALAALARTVGSPAIIAEATDRSNRQEIKGLADVTAARVPEGGRAGVLGLSYKPNTEVVEEAPGLLLVQALESRGVDVVVYDPAAMESARRTGTLGDAVEFAAEAEECVRDADVVVIATAWPEFADLDPALFERSGTPCVVIDCWRVLDESRFEGIAEYVALGRDEPDALPLEPVA